MSEGLTLKKFEEASEIVNKVTLNTNLIYSDYFSEQTGNKVYIKLHIFWFNIYLIACLF